MDGRARRSGVKRLKSSSPPSLSAGAPLALLVLLILSASSLCRGYRLVARAGSSSRCLQSPSLSAEAAAAAASVGSLRRRAATIMTNVDGDGGGTRRARIVGATEVELRRAGEKLRQGGLVAFPTETVYGLGANALDENAVLSIFRAKGRPRSDPLIVHVEDLEAALDVVSVEGSQGAELSSMLSLLAKAFWPGPLTLVAKASNRIPSAVTAGTGFVGVRCPAHPVAKSLLECAGVPVCAPSANRFGHVSPTTAQHVMGDLEHEDVTIVDGGTRSCSVGIESTVARVETSERKITILRKGAISPAAIASNLRLANADWTVEELMKNAEATADTPVTVVNESEPQVAPGQLLRHYAPDVEAYLVPVSRYLKEGDIDLTDGTVVIDFGASMDWCKGKSQVCGYRDLSVQGSAVEAAKCLFDALRWAETVEGAARILLVQCPPFHDDDMGAAVNDRLYRACSGRYVALNTSREAD